LVVHYFGVLLRPPAIEMMIYIGRRLPRIISRSLFVPRGLGSAVIFICFSFSNLSAGNTLRG
jgi:hypothetical protein